MRKNKEIIFQSVNFSYGDRRLYPEGISAVLHEGKIYLLKGRNGCGKSTLVNILLKVWRKYEGEVFVNGENIKNISRQELSDMIGLAFQKTPIFHDTIKNNICLGKDGNIKKVLPVMRFEEDLESMGRNIDSWLKDTSSLSGGQAQKIGILRTIYCDKAIYVFDEATANLDQKSKKEFFDLLDSLKKDKIIILISHEDDVEQYVDEVIEIKGGKDICM